MKQERSQSVQHVKPIYRVLGLAVGVLTLVIVSSYAFLITPIGVRLDWRYWLGFAIYAVFGWVWLGVDSIPGRRKASRGFFHSWLVAGLALIIGGFIGYAPLVSPIGFSAFSAFFLALAAKSAWTYGVRGRVRYCQKCGTFRWFLQMNGTLYCNKQGHKLENIAVDN